MWIAVLLAAYIVYRVLSSFSKKSSDYDKELEEVLTSEKYKVKGRYE
jgi:hypothetical protein